MPISKSRYLQVLLKRIHRTQFVDQVVNADDRVLSCAVFRMLFAALFLSGDVSCLLLRLTLHDFESIVRNDIFQIRHDRIAIDGLKMKSRDRAWRLTNAKLCVSMIQCHAAAPVIRGDPPAVTGGDDVHGDFAQFGKNPVFAAKTVDLRRFRPVALQNAKTTLAGQQTTVCSLRKVVEYYKRIDGNTAPITTGCKMKYLFFDVRL